MAYHADADHVDDKEVLTWEGFGEAVREQAQTIVDSGFCPTIIIGIARGGMIPAGALSYALGIKLIDAVNVEFYTDVHETLPAPELLAPMLDVDAITGATVLLVDDVADSGRTLALVQELLQSYEVDCRTAVLYHKSRSIVTPDYSWKSTDKWIVFPWSADKPVEPSTP